MPRCLPTYRVSPFAWERTLPERDLLRGSGTAYASVEEPSPGPGARILDQRSLRDSTPGAGCEPQPANPDGLKVARGERS